MTRPLLPFLIALVLSSCAAPALAQTHVSGGARLTLDELAVEVSIEPPAGFDLMGVRWGPVLSARATVPLRGEGHVEPSASALAGVSGTINLPSAAWAVQVQVLTRAAYAAGVASVTPEFVLAFTTTLD